jgi:FKBP-type peptidyl-prolyl cis-trans isomerase
MKRFFVSCVLAGLVAAGTACAADPELKTEDDKTFYALGLVISNQLATFKLTPAELEIVKAGITDGTLKKKALVELEAFGPKIKPLAEARMAAGATEEKKKGKAFLETIAAKPNVKKTGSGLLMETITEGTGKSPAPSDKVKVNYKGTTIDGTVFDESAKHGGPATFQLDQVIKCWTEGLEFMKTGGKAKLYCPADIAYGDRGQGANIPPGATLVFEVELLEIVK